MNKLPTDFIIYIIFLIILSILLILIPEKIIMYLLKLEQITIFDFLTSFLNKIRPNKEGLIFNARLVGFLILFSLILFYFLFKKLS